MELVETEQSGPSVKLYTRGLVVFAFGAKSPDDLWHPSVSTREQCDEMYKASLVLLVGALPKGSMGMLSTTRVPCEVAKLTNFASITDPGAIETFELAEMRIEAAEGRNATGDELATIPLSDAIFYKLGITAEDVGCQSSQLAA